MRRCKLIAEIGCNHMGDFELACRMIDVAANVCGVRYIKFQKREPRVLLSESQFAAPHPDPQHAFGETYGKHREALEFTLEQHSQLKSYCEARNVVYATSVWDIPSFEKILNLAPQYLKIPSGANTNYALLELVCQKFQGHIHLSLGMTTRAEEKFIMEVFQDNRRTHDLVLYACTSGYPISAGESCLMEIVRLRDLYGMKVANIGYSGHHLGRTIDVAAFALGANYIERHFTIDRNLKGTDHSASLESSELKSLQEELELVGEALVYKYPEILPVEELQRTKLKISALGDREKS